MKLKQYQVDAFATRAFEGNPAAVCPLERWLDDTTLQAIAEENNLSETAFFVPSARGFHLRWFTPTREIELCGHATLASAHVLFTALRHAAPTVLFETLSGDLMVSRQGEFLTMDFPAASPQPCATPAGMAEALGREPAAVFAADDYIVLLENEAEVRALQPDPLLLARLDRRGVCVTARGTEVDFVSRFFAPKYGIAEDPVTGSAHCELAPFWTERLGRNPLRARQVSKRGGEIACEVKGHRVFLSGRAVTFMEAEIAF